MPMTPMLEWVMAFCAAHTPASAMLQGSAMLFLKGHDEEAWYLLFLWGYVALERSDMGLGPDPE